MRLDEMVELIRAAVPQSGGTWADLGAGTGNFTRALSTLLGIQATIYAVDRTLPEPAFRMDGFASKVQWQYGDFTGPMTLPILDGILMANALHFVRDQAQVLANVCGYLQPGGRLVLVEYAIDVPLSYIPHPLPLARFVALAGQIGLNAPRQTGVRRSPSTGIVMYTALAIR